jgi:hypothetical protein
MRCVVAAIRVLSLALLALGCGDSDDASPTLDAMSGRGPGRDAARDAQPHAIDSAVPPSDATVVAMDATLDAGGGMDATATQDSGRFDAAALDATPAPVDAAPVDSGPPDADVPDAPDANDASDATVGQDAVVPAPRPDIAIAKWYDNRTAAISLNLDGWADNSPGVMQLVREHGLALDCELVTGSLDDERIDLIHEVLVPNGITFFGHGQVHSNHDAMTYEQAFDSASQCFDTMTDLGLKPVSFAYPGGHGQQLETRQAIEAAGFLSARGHKVTSHPYIVQDELTHPPYWYLLPDIVMESYDYSHSASRTNDTAELIPFLDGAIIRTAWIILTYHGIGDPNAFGFYYLSDFASDLEEIVARDFWSASMDAATLYVRERESATTSIERVKNGAGALDHLLIYLGDDLPNDRYVQPLTLLFEVPPEWVGVPLAIEDDERRWPDQVAGDTYAKISLPPFERHYRISVAQTPYVPPVPPIDDEDAGATAR